MPMERDLVSLLQAGASATPDKPVYSFLDKDLNCTGTFTYAGLLKQAIEMACHLQRCGLNRTPVLLVQPRQSDFVKSFWACLLAGAWPMPCARPRAQKWQQFANMATQSGASAILTSSSMACLIPRHELSDIPVIVADAHDTDSAGQTSPQSLAQWIRPSVCPDDIAFIQYTSGSTSNPKGVVVTHENVMANLASIRKAFACSTSDTGLTWLPLHHDMGLIGHVLQPLYSGIHNYFLSPVDYLSEPSRWIHAISKYRVTISGGPGFAFGFCARQQASPDSSLDLSRWRLAYCGSDRIAADVLEQFSNRYSASGFSSEAWFPCYGMAESTLYVCGIRGVILSSDNTGDQSSVCIGDIAGSEADADIKIVQPDSGQVCAEGDVGEICISSPSVSPGYYRQSILSRRSFNQLVGSQTDFFRTGDLGFMRGEKLYFSGRLKNVIKVRGRSLHAEDIESLLHHETADTGLRRCVALGIHVEDMDSFVILAEHKSRRPALTIPNKKLLERQLRNLVCDTFGVNPHAVIILPPATLPLTSSGKPVRSMCMQVYKKYIETERPRYEEPVNA